MSTTAERGTEIRLRPREGTITGRAARAAAVRRRRPCRAVRRRRGGIFSAIYYYYQLTKRPRSIRRSVYNNNNITTCAGGGERVEFLSLYTLYVPSPMAFRAVAFLLHVYGTAAANEINARDIRRNFKYYIILRRHGEQRERAPTHTHSQASHKHTRTHGCTHVVKIRGTRSCSTPI